MLEEEEQLIPETSNEQKAELLAQAQMEADSMKAEANAYRASIEEQMLQAKLDWEQERAQLSEQAQQSGFLAGFEEGKQQGYEEARGYIEEARKKVEISKDDYRKKIESAEDTILHLGLKVAERILGAQLASDPESFLPVVKRALKEAREYQEVGLHIHPCHYEFLISHKDDLLSIFPKETELYIYPDADMHEQGCIIESANGRIDASVDIQLAEVKTKLLELLESE